VKDTNGQQLAYLYFEDGAAAANVDEAAIARGGSHRQATGTVEEQIATQ